MDDVKSFQIANYDLSLNRYFWEQPGKAPSIILSYAIGKEACKIEIDDAKMFAQIVFLYYRHPDYLPNCIKFDMDNMELPYDEDYCGFESDGADFNPEGEISYLCNYAKTHESFLIYSRNFFRFYVTFTAPTKFHFVYNSDKYSWFSEFKPYWDLSAKGIITSLPVQLALELQNKSCERDFALMAMYSSVRSIVGFKNVAATTKAFIHARMFGAKNANELDSLIANNNDLMQPADNWNPNKHRRKFDGLLEELRVRHLISFYGGWRRLFVSLETDDETFARSIADFLQSKKKKNNVGTMIDKYINDG